MKVFQTMEHGKRHKRVVFLIGGWSYRLFALRPVAWVLALNGFHCITYCYDYDVFSPDYVKTRRDLLVITNDVLKRIKKLKKRGKTEFSVFGISLGSAIAVLVANKAPEVAKVILNTTSGETARTVWSWDNIKASFKLALLDKNMTLRRLIKEWRPISPIYHIDNFKDKKVLVYLVKKDVVTPYKMGLELVGAMRHKGAHCKVKVNKHLRHSLGGIYNLTKPKRYTDFLKDR